MLEISKFVKKNPLNLHYSKYEQFKIKFVDAVGKSYSCLTVCWVEFLLPVSCNWGRKTWAESDGIVGKTPSQARKQVTALGTPVLGHGEARAFTDISASVR